MIINTKHRFVFVHVPKTGGTSIRKALTPLEGNRNDLCHPLTKHETLQQLQDRMAEEPLEPMALPDFFKFGLVRNPWDKIASLYRYLKEHRPRAEIDSIRSFDDFLLSLQDQVDWVMSLHSLRVQLEFFEVGGQVDCQFFGRYERLASEMKRLQRLLNQESQNRTGSGLNFDFRLPHLNRSSHYGRDYRLDYDSQGVEIVRKHFQRDIDRFNYDFESGCVEPARQSR